MNDPNNQTDKTRTSALCGCIEAVIVSATANHIDHNGNSYTFTGNTYGENGKPIKVQVTASNTPAQQILSERNKAEKAGSPVFRFQTFGSVEVDFLPSQLPGSPERPLLLTTNATQIKPVHPNLAIDPNIHSCFLLGTISGGKFPATSIEFNHIETDYADNKSPASVPLSGKSKEKVSHLASKPVLVIGRFGYQASLEPTLREDGSTTPAYEKLSFSITDFIETVRFAGYSRSPAKQSVANSVISASYEEGYGCDAPKMDSKAFESLLKDLDY